MTSAYDKTGTSEITHVDWLPKDARLYDIGPPGQDPLHRAATRNFEGQGSDGSIKA